VGKVRIAVALYGAWSRALQPGVLDTIEAIHDGGRPQAFDRQVYPRLIEGIRSQVDVSRYPSCRRFSRRASTSAFRREPASAAEMRQRLRSSMGST
jgi:3-keto-5-aminohexanoate cleavage enzyme